MTTVYFVRHAQPDYGNIHDRTRALTPEGKQDTKAVLQFFKTKRIDCFYSSNYKRSIDTIASTAAYFHKRIHTDFRLREREKGPNGNNRMMFQKRWSDFSYQEPGGENLQAVQQRNVAALQDILHRHRGQTIVIGTHGTSLSTILNFYDSNFGCADFLRIIDWMPYIIELTFDGDRLVGKREHLHIEKEFKSRQKMKPHAEQETAAAEAEE